jgi:hypothetical protein
MLCHQRIIIHYPPIQNILARDYENKTPVEWVRINDLPDLAHFFHNVHIGAGFDCGRCHGDVGKMDRVVLVNKFDMGFCIKCHKEEGGSTDCFKCHY